jgi:TonB-dependent SusC/RagA subfamily outer membrane receptor
VPQAPLSTNSDKIYVVVEDITGGKPDEIVLVKTIESGNGTEKKISIDLKKEKPLIVIDGVITSDLDMNKINPSNIASMNVMKGEKAKEKYGEKGANGVVEITTKKP